MSTLDIDQIEPSALLTPATAKIGGALLGMAGFFVTGTALQLSAESSGVLHALATFPVWLFGLSALLVGPSMFNGHGWAAILGALIAPCAALFCLGWAIYAVVSLSFLPMLLLGLGSAGLAALAAPFAIAPSVRVSRTRRLLLAG